MLCSKACDAIKTLQALREPTRNLLHRWSLYCCSDARVLFRAATMKIDVNESHYWLVGLRVAWDTFTQCVNRFNMFISNVFFYCLKTPYYAHWYEIFESACFFLEIKNFLVTASNNVMTSFTFITMLMKLFSYYWVILLKAALIDVGSHDHCAEYLFTFLLCERIKMVRRHSISCSSKQYFLVNFIICAVLPPP